MKAIQVLGAYQAKVAEVPDPVLTPGNAIVKIRSMGICGTDVATYKAINVNVKSYPIIIGHEIAGEIDETHAHKTAHAWLNGDLYLIYCAVRPLKGDAERAKFYKGKAWNEYRCLTIARSRPWADAERASMR